MKGAIKYLTGIAGPSGFGSKSTAEQVTLRHCCSPRLPLTAIVTGATSGIGAETARVLAKRGVRVVLPARNVEKAREVKERIAKESPNASVLIMEIDLSSLASVFRFCSHFLSLGLPLNILINNAGTYSPKMEFSEDKIEMTFATNYLGHFLLTELLVEKMIETAEETGSEGRIVNVSSVIHNWVREDNFRFNHLLHPKNYYGTRAYAQSKLAAILHAKEMARQLKERKARVTINAVHPGIVKTGIIRAHRGFITDSLFFIASKLLKSTSQGAASTCYVAVREEAKGKNGVYFADCNECRCSPLADDPHLAQSLFHNTRALIYKTLHHHHHHNHRLPPPAFANANLA